MVIKPAIYGQPSFVVDLGNFAVNFWRDNPVTTDLFASFIQVFLSVGFIFFWDHILSKFIAVASMLWSLCIWLMAEGFGRIMTPGATWLVGSPGAALFYFLASVLLLVLPRRYWFDVRFGKLATKSIGFLFIFYGVVQVFPWEGFWSGKRLSIIFYNSSLMRQPKWLSFPAAKLAVMASKSPIIVNGVIVLITLAVGIMVVFWPKRAIIPFLMLLFLGWWLGSDFGVLGGWGTDPNSQPMIAIFFVLGLRLQKLRRYDDDDGPKQALDKRHISTSPQLTDTSREGAGLETLSLSKLLGLWLFVAMLIATLYTSAPIVSNVFSANSAHSRSYLGLCL